MHSVCRRLWTRSGYAAPSERRSQISMFGRPMALGDALCEIYVAAIGAGAAHD